MYAFGVCLEKLMREEIRDPLKLRRALDECRHFCSARRLHRTPLPGPASFRSASTFQG